MDFLPLSEELERPDILRYFRVNFIKMKGCSEK